MVAPGSVLAGKYRLEWELGRGGMGSVWRATHVLLDAPVALKLILLEGSDPQQLEQRFLLEARAAAALRSPHVVQVLDYGISDGTPFIAMELLEGESLAARLARRGTLTPAETVRIVTHVARALARAHELGIVHRDLKPANIFLVPNLDDEIAKVLDFGIAKRAPVMGFGELTKTGMMMGTPHYMSPEQARCRREIDGRADVWALGVIAFECLTGRTPFDGDSVAELIVKICSHAPPLPSSLAPVPPGFDAWFARALAREASERFQNVAEMAEALRALVPDAAPTPLATRAPSAAPPRRVTESPLVVGGLALALTTLAIALGFACTRLSSVGGTHAPAPSSLSVSNPSSARNVM